MIDPLALLDDVFSGLDGSEIPPVPGFEASVPGAVPGNGPTYPVVIADSSRTSRCSRSENEGSGKNHLDPVTENDTWPENVARARLCVETPGTPGTPGNEEKSLAGSTFPQFPVKDREPGTPGTENAACGRPLLDLNRAAPQRSDWWTGPAMAEADRLAPLPGDPLPIAPADVRAGVARELRALAEDGREGPTALRDAVEITRAKIRNSEALAPGQWNGSLCHVCNGSLNDGGGTIAVLTGKPGRVIHLHAACHPEHRRRITALVDGVMAAAGYGAEAAGGAA